MWYELDLPVAVFHSISGSTLPLSVVGPNMCRLRLSPSSTLRLMHATGLKLSSYNQTSATHSNSLLALSQSNSSVVHCAQFSRETKTQINSNVDGLSMELGRFHRFYNVKILQADFHCKITLQHFAAQSGLT